MLTRYNGIAGKHICNRVYVHKDYADKIIPKWLFDAAKKVVGSFSYNCVMWDVRTCAIRFDSASDFDTAREPHVGCYVTVDCFGNKKYGFSNSIWHHKWLWVGEDYKGFDVIAAYKWSLFWTHHVKETAKGTDKTFNEQLKEYGLAKFSNI